METLHRWTADWRPLQRIGGTTAISRNDFKSPPQACLVVAHGRPSTNSKQKSALGIASKRRYARTDKNVLEECGCIAGHAVAQLVLASISNPCIHLHLFRHSVELSLFSVPIFSASGLY